MFSDPSLRQLKAAFHRGSHFACGRGAGQEFQGRFFCGCVGARCAIKNLPVVVIEAFSAGQEFSIINRAEVSLFLSD